jgi:hypothetical protein
MGKASSTKKVQRAARAGGRVSSGQPRGLLFPGIIALVVVLGVSLVVYARNDRLDDDLGGVPQLDDHIHQAFGVNVCGEFKGGIPTFESQIGIHTHGDGVVHIHPHSQLGVGVNATLGRYFENAREEGGLDVEISDSKLSYLGEEVEEGETECEGVEDPQLLLAFWKDASDASSLPEVLTGDFNDKRLTDDGGAITIYYGDPDEDIPMPPTAADLAELGAVDGAGAVPPPSETTTTIESDETSTTASGETTTTTTADATTTTASP